MVSLFKYTFVWYSEQLFEAVSFLSFTLRLVFLVAQIKCRAKVLKTWHGLKVAESSTLNEVYNGYASGTLDDGKCISDSYNTIKV